MAEPTNLDSTHWVGWYYCEYHDGYHPIGATDRNVRELPDIMECTEQGGPCGPMKLMMLARGKLKLPEHG